jgi:signal peptidase I
MHNFWRDLIGVVLLAALIFFLLRLVIGSFVVVSASMEPGVYEGERLLVNKMAYSFGEPDRGEIVVFKSPAESNISIKRIIGLPGDIVEVKDRQVYVNGIALEEPYLKDFPLYTMAPVQVPEGQYFVLGDNRNDSSDSHAGWTVPRGNIVGRAWIFAWPPDKWGLVGNFPLDRQVMAAEPH